MFTFIQVDVDHSGTLDFEEFFDLMSSMMGGWDPVTDLGNTVCSKNIFIRLMLVRCGFFPQINLLYYFIILLMLVQIILLNQFIILYYFPYAQNTHQNFLDTLPSLTISTLNKIQFALNI